MYKRFRSILEYFRGNKATVILLFVCSFGLAFGTFLAGVSDGKLLHLLRDAVAARISFAGLIVFTLAPFLLSILCLFLGYPKLLLWICFFHSFRISYISMSCYGIFGPGGWLIRLLFQFSDLVLFPVFCWFLLRNVSRHGRAVHREIIICLLAAVAVTGFDYCLVSPFLAMLIDI